jgi:hypothetical protein
MTPRYLVLVFALAAGLGWWLLGESPEEQVLAAHEELRQLLRKSEDDDATPSIRDALAYQALFADPMEISGSTGGLNGSYSPEETAALILRVRAIFRTVELTFSKPQIEFLSPDSAVGHFAAELRASPGYDELADGVETREVTSRLQQIDGDWVFAAFEFALQEAD